MWKKKTNVCVSSLGNKVRMIWSLLNLFIFDLVWLEVSEENVERLRMLSYFPILHSYLHMNPNMVLAVWDTLCLLWKKMRWGEMVTGIYTLSPVLCRYHPTKYCWTPSSGSGNTLDPEETQITVSVLLGDANKQEFTGKCNEKCEPRGQRV